MSTGEPYFGRREKILLKSSDDDELRERHLEFIFQPIRGPDRFEGVLVQGYDVTEEVVAEESQRILINELNHRVKKSSKKKINFKKSGRREPEGRRSRFFYKMYRF